MHSHSIVDARIPFLLPDLANFAAINAEYDLIQQKASQLTGEEITFIVHLRDAYLNSPLMNGIAESETDALLNYILNTCGLAKQPFILK